jgi:hypothetical protein
MFTNDDNVMSQSTMNLYFKGNIDSTVVQDQGKRMPNDGVFVVVSLVMVTNDNVVLTHDEMTRQWSIKASLSKRLHTTARFLKMSTDDARGSSRRRPPEVFFWCRVVVCVTIGKKGVLD